MIGLIRLSVFLALFLTLVYVLVSIYSRSVRREKLEERWEAEGSIGDRDDYVKAGMVDYDKSLRKRLIWLVYVIPVTIIVALVYLLNFA